MKSIRFVAFVMIMVVFLSSCDLLPPKPTDEQIIKAVKVSNEAKTEPLELVFDEMEVPQRSPGRAAAILWIADKSIQRNFTVKYDRGVKTFYVESYITLLLGEDGCLSAGGMIFNLKPWGQRQGQRLAQEDNEKA